jgi:hypothetical protein
VRATSAEHDVDVKAPARAADGPRPDGAVAERDDALPLSGLGAAPPGLLQARMLLGLQAMAGNAAVASLIETRKPEPPLSAPPRSDGAEAQSEGAEPGTPIEDRPAPTIPDVSAADPANGLAQVGNLPPAALLSSLEMVSTAAERQTTDEHGRLAADAPQRPRHPGAPATVEFPASARLAVGDGPALTSLPAMPGGRDIPVKNPPALPPTAPMPIADGQLPTRDPGLELKPGTLPHLPLEGSADPALLQQQRSRVVSGIEREKASGHENASRPLGEDEIFPTAPAERLRGSVGEIPRAVGQAAGQLKPAEDDEAASIIAQQEKGPEIHSAIGTGLASFAGQREEYAQRTTGERARADAEMSQLEQANSQEQAGQRAAARHEVAGLRTQWTTAQQEVVAGAQREADAKTTETVESVSQERSAAEEQATAHFEQGQQEAQKARHEAEQQAVSERQKAQRQNQGGLLGAIGSAAQSLFDKAKQAVQSVFDRARQLVRGAIERAHQLATAVMERARQAIVGAIRLAGTVLTAIGDRVLVAFPALRDRFRKAIQERVAAAELAVNKLANVLKHAVQTALNLLGATLSAAIGLLHRGMQAAIDGVRSAVHGALDFARGAIAALGTFAFLIKDIAVSPLHWISNLAAAARDGIRNHLWPDLKGAIRGWFSEKVDSILGLGTGMWSLLKSGGISATHVASIAWDGIKSMIPQTVIWILIEKLVALIVPAAAAVMLIVQALQAAWGSLGRILQAVDAFVGFLKGVRWGNAGPLFGKAIAAGAVAVIEFISQFLLQRLMSAAGAVADKLKSLAKRIGARLATVGRGVVRGVKWVSSGTGRLIDASSKLAKRATTGVGDTWFLMKNRRLALNGMAWIDRSGDRCLRHGPLNPGPLETDVAETFRSASYTARRLAQPKDLWRAYSVKKRKLGAYWTDIQPRGPLQTSIDSALHPSFKNAATKVVHIRVPAGTTVYEGSAGPKGYPGGGPQFLLKKRPPSWEV